MELDIAGDVDGLRVCPQTYHPLPVYAGLKAQGVEVREHAPEKEAQGEIKAKGSLRDPPIKKDDGDTRPLCPSQEVWP
jgi:hypothetical protein